MKTKPNPIVKYLSTLYSDCHGHCVVKPENWVFDKGPDLQRYYVYHVYSNSDRPL